MHAARSALRNSKDRRGDTQYKKTDHHDRKNKAFAFSDLGATTERKALLQEKNTSKDTCSKANKRDPCIEIAASHTKNHAQRATKKNKTADHHYESQYKTSKWRRSRRCLEFPGCNSRNASSHNYTDNLGSQILHGFISLKLHSTCRISDEAGDTDGHIPRIAVRSQHDSHNSGNSTTNDQDNTFFR